MNAPPVSRATRSLGALALLTCTALALVNLASGELPYGWVLAWTVPAALLCLLRPFTPRLWQQVLVAGLLQGGAVWAALAWAEPLSRPAALACTILPPLAFVTVRQRDADAALALFLSFCVLLVGIILTGTNLWLVASYGLAAALCLRCDSHQAACSASWGPRSAPARSPASSARQMLATGVLVALPCLFAALTIERTLAMLPSPARGPAVADTGPGSGRGGQRSIGLGDSFVLDGGKGMLAELHGEQLVRATMSAGGVVPTDLYLRSGFFAVPGLDRWQSGTLEVQSDLDGTLELRRPLAPGNVRWLELERYAGARNFVFAPPATCTVRGVTELTYDLAREWLRQGPRGNRDLYEVGYQELPPPPRDLPFDPRAARQGLLALPDDFDRAPFLALLDEWQASGTTPQIAERIARGLASRCRYDRAEPTGPFGHALENFLFAREDRHGYCMHFASAAALLLRLRNVPCRIGVGLYGGDLDRNDPHARFYGSQHAHAWVEIPYAGRGFVVFDPTPPVERGARMPSQLAPSPDLDEAPVVERSAAEIAGDLVSFLTQPWLLGVVMLLAIAIRLRPGDAAPIPIAPTPPSAKTARRLLGRILRALGTAGHTRRRGQTLEAFGRELAALQRLPREVQDAFRVYQEVRFGGRPFDRTREQCMQRGLDAALQMEVAQAPAPAIAPA